MLAPRPTWQFGYADSAWKSAYPDEWNSLVGAWLFCLGSHGLDRLLDISPGRNHAIATGYDPEDWGPNYFISNQSTAKFATCSKSFQSEVFDGGELSYTFWFEKINNGNNNWVFSNYDGTGGSSHDPIAALSGASNSAQLAFFHRGSGWLYANTTGLNDGKIHHGVITYNAGDLRFYVDGKPDGNTSAANSISTAGVAFVINGVSGNPGFQVEGNLYDIRFYGRVLTPAEVTQQYERGIGSLAVLNPVLHPLDVPWQPTPEPVLTPSEWNPAIDKPIRHTLRTVF